MTTVEVCKRLWHVRRYYDSSGEYHTAIEHFWAVMVDGVCRDVALTRRKARERARLLKR